MKSEKTKIRKKDLNDKTRQITKTTERIDDNNFIIEYFDVALFMKQKPRNKAKKTKRQTQGNKIKNKKQRKQGRKK